MRGMEYLPFQSSSTGSAGSWDADKGSFMRRRQFPAGTMVFTEGDVAKDAYLLRSGRIELLKSTLHGPFRLAVLGKGDVLGEMGLLDDRVRSVSARVVEDVVADAVSAEEFMDLLSQQPAKAMEILRCLFERLRSISQRLSEFTGAGLAFGPIPRIKLVPLTPETRTMLPDDGLDVLRFPFRIGRVAEGEEKALFGMNELEFHDRRPHILSLHHFSLDLGPQTVVVRDRGSRLGTLVNGEPIGSTTLHDFAPLRPGENEVVAAALRLPPERKVSPYRFLVVAR
jgi:hypothetical protein